MPWIGRLIEGSWILLSDRSITGTRVCVCAHALGLFFEGQKTKRTNMERLYTSPCGFKVFWEGERGSSHQMGRWQLPL